MTQHVLVVDSLSEFLQEQSVPAGLSIRTCSTNSIPAGECAGFIPDVTTRIGRSEMQRLRGLRVIANYGVGYDNIDIGSARELGIAVSNTPGVLTDATAELTWALVLAVTRRVSEGERMVRAQQWPGWQPTQLRGRSLKGRRLGIIGAGRIGREVGLRARAFGMHVVYWSRTRQREWELACDARFAQLEEILSTCDVVSIHLSKSAETEKLVDVRMLKDGAVLINTARGAVVDEAVLMAELQSGRISAGLDVYVNEPTVPAELLSLDNVVLLPHIGSATYEARRAMWDMAWQNLLRGLAGEPLVNPVT